jgi:hypothetical protein
MLKDTSLFPEELIYISRNLNLGKSKIILYNFSKINK